MPARVRIPLAVLALFVPFSLSAQSLPVESAEPLDLLIRGGHVMDGTGNPWFEADVGIRDGMIVAVGTLAEAPAQRVIDATGLVVVPGIIDVHSHAGRGLDEGARRRAAPNLVSQGVTTVTINQDGRSPWPISEQRDAIAERGAGPNVILMVGHGRVREMAMGEDDVRRAASPAEIERMRELVRQAMDAGAWGLSAGLEYAPGRWSTTDEVVALVEEVVPYGGVYIVHERSEGRTPMWWWPSRHEPGPPTLVDAVLETIEIGERTGATVIATHIKAKGARYWGSSRTAIRLIDAARARGVEVYADQYPYNTSGSDGNTVLIPDWVYEDEWDREENERDFAAALREVLDSEERTAALRRDIAHEIKRRGGADRVVVFEYPDSSYIGRSVGELAESRDISPVDMAIRLQLEGWPDEPGGGRLRGFSMWERDVFAYMRQPWTLTASDAGIALPDDGSVHARYYGTFPRKIAHFALELGTITMEHAIRSMTSLPAQVLGLERRGQVREGFHADIAVLDLDRLEATATFFEPHQYARGVEYVLVGGEFVVDGGELTWALPGMVLTPASSDESGAAITAAAGRSRE